VARGIAAILVTIVVIITVNAVLGNKPPSFRIPAPFQTPPSPKAP
jgi:hypothetical protein